MEKLGSRCSKSIVITIFIISWSVWDFLRYTPGIGWIVLTLFAVLTIFGTIKVPHLGIVIFLGDLYLMSVAVLYGISTCVVATVFYALVTLVALRGQSNLMRIFNFCTLICNSFLFSVAFLFSVHSYSAKITDLILPVLIMSFISFIFIYLLTATMLTWTHKIGVSKLWVKKSPALILKYVVSAVGVVLMVLMTMFLDSILVSALVIPVILVSWVFTKMVAQRIDTAV